MGRPRPAPVSGMTVFAVVLIVLVALLAGGLALFAGSECSQTETGCRHNEIDFN